MNRSALVLGIILAATSSTAVWAANPANPDSDPALPGQNGADTGPGAGSDGHGPSDHGPGGPGGFEHEHAEHHGGHDRWQHREPPVSYTEKTTRTYADGRVLKREVDQKVTATRFERKVVTVLPDGRKREFTIRDDRKVADNGH